MVGQTWAAGFAPEQETLGEETTGAEARPPALFASGELLDETYEIRRLLGEGGMGQVFEAHDHALNREVAIKAYWPSNHASRSGLLRREAQALAAIHHPGLATVFTVRRHRGMEFMVMERIRGLGLDELMRERRRMNDRLPTREAIRILVAIAEVLQAVHAAGCLHRDVKPGNVMLAGRERVVLTDFGIFLPEGELNQRALVAGSPGYMAPESILDNVRPGAGHLIDLYALGVIAFELLTGRPPYQTGNVQALFIMHISTPIPEVSPLAPDVPPRLATLTRELLAKDPYDRPDSEEVVWRLHAARAEYDRAARVR
jgi:serine/threonine-protein kinase